MKKIFLLIPVLFCGYIYADAQVIDDENGKTFYYYDSSSKKKVKEIYHHIQEFRMIYDHEGNTRDTILHIKNGPYTKYYENGTLECSGYFDREVKTGTWKFYSTEGKLIRTEEWAAGKVVKTTSH